MSRPTTQPDWATNSAYGAGTRPWSGQPNKTQPSGGVIGEGFDPENPLYADFLNWLLNNHGQWIDYLDSAVGFTKFGDGSDGTATMDGATSVAGCSLVGGNYSATRDLCFANLTINSSVLLKMKGFRIFVSGTLTINGTIACNGSGGVAGGNSGIIGASGTSGNGGSVGGTGNPGSAVTVALGGAGGAGGAGNGGFTAGAGGALTAPTSAQGSIHVSQSLLTGLLFGASGSVAVNGGTGGGGGGGAGSTNAGGNGGGPGGVLLIAARILGVGASAAIQAKGEAGGAGAGVGASASGSGGGGGGGAVILVYGSLVSGSTTPAAVIDVTGGAGGTGGNASGSPGNAGNSYVVAGS